MTGPRRFGLYGLLAAASLTGAACVSSDDIEGLHRQMGDIQKQIQTLEKKSSSKEEVEKLNQNVATQTTQLLKSNADTAIRLSELTTKMEQLEAKLEDTNRRLSQLSQQIAETQSELLRLRNAGGGATMPGAPPAGAAGSPATTARPGAAGPSPSELYDTAYGDYSKGRYALAIQGFQDYLSTYPSTDLSDNAQYWIGESHFAQRKFQESIADFTELLKTVAGERQGGCGPVEEGLRPARAGPEGRGHRPAPVRHPRVPVLRGGPTGPGAAEDPRGGRQVAGPG